MTRIPASGALMGRATKEWIGRSPDSMPPKAVVDRIFLRQDGRCALTKRKILVSDARQTDHIIALKDHGENRESNLHIIITDKHREKTSAENTARAKVTRIRMKHNGLWPASRNKIKSRGFSKPRAEAPDPDT